MAEGIAFSILEKIGEYLVAPIGRQLRYLFCYNNNMDNLRDQAKNLKDIKDGVQLSAAAARNNLEVIAPRVQSWLTNVEKITTESDRIFKDKAFVDKGCLNGLCPNPKSRYLLSREATKKAQVIAELRSEGEQFSKFSYPAPPTGMAASSSTACSKGLQSRMSLTKEITDALKHDNIAMFGICGMGGIGKTTMVEEIARRAKSESKIDEFAMAVVSQNKDVIRVQSQLADMLGLKFQEQTSIFARAERLRERLMNGNRILVILDDVWEALDMEEIGIPIGNDLKGCKVALTSRNEHVCSLMGTQKNFAIDVLSKQEAWDLFKEMAGNCVDAAEVTHIAEEVAKECGGLPLALVTVARALRNKKKHAWEDALEQLRKSTVTNITGMHKIVYSRIELSYSYLESDQAKSLLLLCCLFQEDEQIPIELLVRYGVGLELFKDIVALAGARNRVCSLVDELRSSYLLLGEGENVFVKMHDVVRDVGLSIASKDGHGYMVQHETNLKEWPQIDKHSPHTAISLYSNEMRGLPAGLDCPNLMLLNFVGTQRNLEVSADFFEGMKELRVINFGVEYIASLPTSFRFLLNLRVLCLESCGFLDNLSLIGGLKKLEILSFFDSKQVFLPSEVGELGNLKLLDLRCRFSNRGDINWFTKIPLGVLSRLRKLEELYMGRYFVQRHDQENCATISELNSLSCLKRLQITTRKGNEYLLKLKDFQFQNLIEYDFSMWYYKKSAYYPEYQFGENSLLLRGVNRIVILENNIIVLLRRTRKVSLKQVRDLKNVVKDLDEDEGFVHLETLEISNCDEVEYFMDAQICHGSHLERDSIQPPSLGNLRVLTLTFCGAIKGMFKKSVVKCLVQLQKLEVTYCYVIEGIILAEGGEENQETQDKIVLPKLNYLALYSLPKLTSFMHTSEKEDNIGSGNIDDGNTTKPLFNQQVLLPNMETLNVGSMKHHVLIAVDQMLGGSLMYNLKHVGVYSCNFMEAVFDLEMLKFGREHVEEVMLDQLESVTLSFLPKLKHVWRKVPKGIKVFHNLKTLEVSGCYSLTYIFSPSMAKMLVNLQSLNLYANSMEEVIRMEEEEEEEDIFEIKMMDKIVFPQLLVLELRRLKNLSVFCISIHDFDLPLLEEVVIEECPKLKSFCSGQLTTPKLVRVRINYAEVFTDQSVWKGDLNSTLAYLSESSLSGWIQVSILSGSLTWDELAKLYFEAGAVKRVQYPTEIDKGQFYVVVVGLRG
ncbi:hypothetical protein LguiB_018511 [Lonicera macranthoides]